MKFFTNLSTHKTSILSVLLVAAAAALGADAAFAMAIDPVDLADAPNPSDEAAGGIEARPAGEKPVEDLAGLKTVLPGKAATATDVRDAGLEAEDYDKDVVLFNKFKYASETILASKVKPVKVNSYIVEHFRVGQPNLDATYVGAGKQIAAGAATIDIDVDDFVNGEVLTEYSTVIIDSVEGYTKDEGGNIISDGALQLYVLNHNDNGNVTFRVCNGAPTGGSAITIPANAKFLVGASAGSESQMRVAPVTFLPEKKPAVLQKKIQTCIITDAFKEQAKKSPLGMSDVIKYTTDIFKRQCARSHWLGQEDRVDVKVKETGNREAAYMEKGILRQIPMLYTFQNDDEITNDDLMAMSAMMFTEFAQSDNATVFVGKEAMKKLMKLVNSAQHTKDVATVSVNEYGIKVRKYADNFGSFDIVYDQTLDELGYGSCMVALDLSSMVRYYMRDEKVQTQDMKKSGESREAEVWNISRIDCYCLKGGNALLACPTSFAAKASKLGGITGHFVATTAEGFATADKTKKHYLTEKAGGFEAGTLIEWDADINDWKIFEGRIFA